MRGIIVTILLCAGLTVMALRPGDRTDGPEAAPADVPAVSEAVSEAVPDEGRPEGRPEGLLQDAEAEAALAPVRALFDAMRARDTAALAAAFHPEARLNGTALRDGVRTVTATAVADFVRSIGAAESELDERLGPAEVRIDGDLATAWTPYAFFVDGEFSHCGVNAFQIVRTADGWKILQVTDTRRREACPAGAPR